MWTHCVSQTNCSGHVVRFMISALRNPSPVADSSAQQRLSVRGAPPQQRPRRWADPCPGAPSSVHASERARPAGRECVSSCWSLYSESFSTQVGASWEAGHVVALLSVLFSDYLRVQGADPFNLVADSFKTIWLYYVKMWNLSVPQKTNISCVTWDTLGNLGWAVWSTVLRVAAGFTRRCDFLFVTSSLFDSFTSVKSVKMLLMFSGNRLRWECEDEESSSDPAVIWSKWSAVLAVWQKYSPKIKFLLISSVMDECSRLLARCEVIRVCWCSTRTFIRSRDGAVTPQINVCCHFNNYTTNVCQNDDISQKQRLILQVCQWTHNGPVYGGPELPKQK